MELTDHQVQQLRQAAADFRRLMEIRSKLHLRVARRVTTILRVGMVSYGLIAVILVIMLLAFNQKLDNINSVLATMTGQFSSMSQDMTVLRGILHKMDEHVGNMNVVGDETAEMRRLVLKLNDQMDTMAATISSIDARMGGLTGQVGAMTANFRYLSPAVQGMGVDFNRMSGPMRMLNEMMPFN